MTESPRIPGHTRERAAAVAYQYLQGMLSARSWRHAERLPTMRDLARKAGVSVNAMGTAVGKLRAEGRVSARPRRGIAVTGATADCAPQATLDQCAAAGPSPALHESIAREILDGPLHDCDALPSPKQLCRRYGVCYRTLRRALDRLCAMGLLRAEGPRRRVCHSWAGRNAAITCILPPGFVRETPGFQASRWHAEFVRVFGQTCGAHGITPHVTTLASTARALGERLDGIPGLIGIALWPPVYTQAYLGGLLSTLRRHTRHVAAFDASGEATVPRPVPSAMHFTLVRSAREACGGAVGYHLLAHGHCRVAYVSPYHDQPWSRRRLNGLVTAFRAAGHPDAVFTCVMQGSGPPAEGRAVSGPATVARRPEQQRATESARQAMVRAGVEVRDDTLLGGVVTWYAEQAALRRLLQPHLTELLRDRSVTAWVGANDKIACLLLEFLRSHRVRVPQEVSVAGFDDTLEASDAGITSYNFDIPRAAMRMVSLLAFPDMFLRPGGPREEEVAGMVVPRESVGPPEAKPAGGQAAASSIFPPRPLSSPGRPAPRRGRAPSR